MTCINILVLVAVAVQLFGSSVESLGFLKIRNASSIQSRNASGISMLQKAQAASYSPKAKDDGNEGAQQIKGTSTEASNGISLVQKDSDMDLYGNADDVESDTSLLGGAHSMLKFAVEKTHSQELNATTLDNSTADSDAVTTADLAGADDDEIVDAIDNDEEDDEDDDDDAHEEDTDGTDNAKEATVADDTSEGADKTTIGEESRDEGAEDASAEDEASLIQQSGSDLDGGETEDDTVESDADVEDADDKNSGDERESLLELQDQDDGDDDQSADTNDESSAREDMEAAFEAEQDKELEDNPFGAAFIQEGKDAQKMTEELGDLADAELEKIQLAEDLESDSSEEDESEEAKLEEDAWTERGAMFGMSD